MLGWVQEGRKGSPPPRPLMSTVDAGSIGKVPPPAPIAPESLPATADAAPAPLPVPTRLNAPQEPTRPAPNPTRGQYDAWTGPSRLLLAPELERSRSKRMGGGVNGSYRLTWNDDAGAEQSGIWKPAYGERADLRATIPAGTYHKREAAMYRLDSLMGGDTVVPPTVSRTVKGDVGSVQQFKADAVEAGKADLDTKQVTEHPSAKRMLLLDLVAANTDRHTGNWMVTGTKGNHAVVAIDNGLAFPRGGRDGLRLGPKNTLRLDDYQHGLVKALKPEEVARALLEQGIEPDAVVDTLGRIKSLQMDRDAVAKAPDADDWANRRWRKQIGDQEVEGILELVGRVSRRDD